MNNRSLITGKSKGGWKGRWRDGSIKRKTDPSIKVRVIYEALTFYDPSLRSTTTLSLYSPAGARFFFHGILEKCTNRNERSIHPRSHSKHRLEEILWLAGDKEKLGGGFVIRAWKWGGKQPGYWTSTGNWTLRLKRRQLALVICIGTDSSLPR